MKRLEIRLMSALPPSLGPAQELVGRPAAGGGPSGRAGPRPHGRRPAPHLAGWIVARALLEPGRAARRMPARPEELLEPSPRV
ncbi:hypothetical protein AB0G20_23015 [Streptomyces sp. NPDC024017]|uniref:hypothetical protein n=1 Tax=Streptomyces sp. NPDC024017 TaxID=3154326 RepID=UPI0033D76A24